MTGTQNQRSHFCQLLSCEQARLDIFLDQTRHQVVAGIRAPRFDHLIHEHESWFHFHIGSLSDKATDRTQRAEHVNAVMQRPTVYLDGEKVWDAGHLVSWNDPDMQEIGRKYGDPAVLFSQRPIWWG